MECTILLRSSKMVEAGGIERPTKPCPHWVSRFEGLKKGPSPLPLPPELAEIAAAWPNLAAPIKAACLALVRASREGQP